MQHYTNPSRQTVLATKLIVAHRNPSGTYDFEVNLNFWKISPSVHYVVSRPAILAVMCIKVFNAKDATDIEAYM
jgi:hypothetical protein